MPKIFNLGIKTKKSKKIFLFSFGAIGTIFSPSSCSLTNSTCSLWYIQDNDDSIQNEDDEKIQQLLKQQKYDSCDLGLLNASKNICWAFGISAASLYQFAKNN